MEASISKKACVGVVDVMLCMNLRVGCLRGLWVGCCGGGERASARRASYLSVGQCASCLRAGLGWCARWLRVCRRARYLSVDWCACASLRASDPRPFVMASKAGDISGTVGADMRFEFLGEARWRFV